MQRWFFLEDPRNELMRKATVEPSRKSEEGSVEITTAVQYRPWVFKVRAPEMKTDQIVCVSGNTPELGRWLPEKCVQLQNNGRGIWSQSIKIQDKKRVHYRYCVCSVVEPGSVLVHTWETNLQPRKIKSRQKAPEPSQDPDTYGTYEGQTSVDKGWLITGAVIQLKVCRKPFKLFRPCFANRKMYIKVTPVNVIDRMASLTRQSEDSLNGDGVDFVENPKHCYTYASNLLAENTLFKLQGPYGQKYKEGDMVVFNCQVINLSITAFLIDLYIYSSRAVEDEPPYLAGFSYLLPGALDGSVGTVVLPLTSTKQRPLGELKIEYLIILPIVATKMNLSVSYSKYWKSAKHGLDVGHRGSGSSFNVETKDCAEIRENTLASLRTAINSGADYVEFDVQLSKDMVAVIYHDFFVCMAIQRKKQLVESDMIELPLKELTLDQLRCLKVYHVVEGKTKNPRFFDEDLEEHQPFPTLQAALETLDKRAGFNIEIKWNNKLMDGSNENYDPIEFNVFVDTILAVVLRFAGERRIIFSSFNPDICSSVRIKQNKYPIMFLTQGETTRYDSYADPRCWSIKSGIQYVKMIDILGLNAHTEIILKEPSLIQCALSKGLVLFCWGDDTNNPKTIQYLKDLGLHGIIYDKIYQFINKENIYVLEASRSQTDLIRKAAATVIEVTPQAAQSQAAIKIKNFEKAREVDGVLSTATSLESLESDIPKDTMKGKNKKK